MIAVTPEDHGRVPLPGALVISLDFELHWGIRDRHSVGGAYDKNLLGAREAIPRILDLFREFDVAATWATVGILFSRSRSELHRFTPDLKPHYADSRLSAYQEVVGESEEEDPLHYAPSLIESIRRTPRQEIGTHTFSHYYCCEPGSTPESFAADLEAARAIAREQGVLLRSIVFPRNQHNPTFASVLDTAGITAYRGNPESRSWRFSTGQEGARLGKRLGRLADTYLDISGSGVFGWHEVLEKSGLANVRASCFLRPYSRRLRALEGLRLRRIQGSLRFAARKRGLYHIWWHPHNFGAHTNENLAFLRTVLGTFAECRAEHGMQSFTMAEVSDRAHREWPYRPAAAAHTPLGRT